MAGFWDCIVLYRIKQQGVRSSFFSRAYVSRHQLIICPINYFSPIAETEALSFEHELLDNNNICKIKTAVQTSKTQFMSHLHMKSSAHYMRISNFSDISISYIKYVFLIIVHHNLLFSHPK